jgi:hypothetical protein
MDDPEFQRGDVDIGYLERAGARLAAAAAPEAHARAVAVAAALLADERRAGPPPATATPAEPGGNWTRAARLEGLRP